MKHQKLNVSLRSTMAMCGTREPALRRHSSTAVNASGLHPQQRHPPQNAAAPAPVQPASRHSRAVICSPVAVPHTGTPRLIFGPRHGLLQMLCADLWDGSPHFLNRRRPPTRNEQGRKTARKRHSRRLLAILRECRVRTLTAVLNDKSHRLSISHHLHHLRRQVGTVGNTSKVPAY